MAKEYNPYRSGIHTLLFNTKKPSIVKNADAEHGLSIYAELFSFAKLEIYMLVKDLKKEIFDDPDVIEAAADALKREVYFEIITQDEVPDDTGFYRLMKKNGVSIEYIKEASGVLENFCIADLKACRVEPTGSKNDVDAVAYFHDPEKALHYKKIYDDTLDKKIDPLPSIEQMRVDIAEHERAHPELTV